MISSVIWFNLCPSVFICGSILLSDHDLDLPVVLLAVDDLSDFLGLFAVFAGDHELVLAVLAVPDDPFVAEILGDADLAGVGGDAVDGHGASGAWRGVGVFVDVGGDALGTAEVLLGEVVVAGVDVDLVGRGGLGEAGVGGAAGVAFGELAEDAAGGELFFEELGLHGVGGAEEKDEGFAGLGGAGGDGVVGPIGAERAEVSL